VTPRGNEVLETLVAFQKPAPLIPRGSVARASPRTPLPTTPLNTQGKEEAVAEEKFNSGLGGKGEDGVEDGDGREVGGADRGGGGGEGESGGVRREMAQYRAPVVLLSVVLPDAAQDLEAETAAARDSIGERGSVAGARGGGDEGEQPSLPPTLILTLGELPGGTARRGASSSTKLLRKGSFRNDLQKDDEVTVWRLPQVFSITILYVFSYYCRKLCPQTAGHSCIKRLRPALSRLYQGAIKALLKLY